MRPNGACGWAGRRRRRSRGDAARPRRHPPCCPRRLAGRPPCRRRRARPPRRPARSRPARGAAPQLAADAPVLDVLQLVAVDALEALRQGPHAPARHGVDRRPRQRRHAQEPLFADQRLDDLVRCERGMRTTHGTFRIASSSHSMSSQTASGAADRSRPLYRPATALSVPFRPMMSIASSRWRQPILAVRSCAGVTFNTPVPIAGWWGPLRARAHARVGTWARACAQGRVRACTRARSSACVRAYACAWDGRMEQGRERAGASAPSSPRSERHAPCGFCVRVPAAKGSGFGAGSEVWGVLEGGEGVRRCRLTTFPPCLPCSLPRACARRPTPCLGTCQGREYRRGKHSPPYALYPSFGLCHAH
eukprot:356922-Chlamydomonas_euryale.AAC.2